MCKNLVLKSLFLFHKENTVTKKTGKPRINSIFSNVFDKLLDDAKEYENSMH